LDAEHVESGQCWCAPLRDDQAENVWIHFDAIHPSHRMRLENGSVNNGIWAGTWRCKRCRRADYRGRDGSRSTMAALNEPCSTGGESA
jgi:hypothetical protein